MKKNCEPKYRRRMEGKTNYRKRLALLKSRKPRLVVRKSLRHTKVQVVEYDPSGDKVLVTAVSKELEKLGWKHGTGSLPAAYLTGLICGKRAVEKGTKEAVLDIGLNEPIHGSKVFAALNGALDGGLTVPHDESALPSKERINGGHIGEGVPKDFEAVKKKITGGDK